MRVTKAIREYVETQIRAKAEESLAELKNRADDARAAYEADRDAANKKYSEFYNKLRNELAEKHNVADSHSCRTMCVPDIAHWLPDVMAYNDARNKAYNKINNIVTEILATMELGGTKAELIEMINNVEF